MNTQSKIFKLADSVVSDYLTLKNAPVVKLGSFTTFDLSLVACLSQIAARTLSMPLILPPYVR